MKKIVLKRGNNGTKGVSWLKCVVQIIALDKPTPGQKTTGTTVATVKRRGGKKRH